MAEGARLESVYTETYRGFESLLLRQYQKVPKGAFFHGESVGDRPARNHRFQSFNSRKACFAYNARFTLLRQLKKRPSAGFVYMWFSCSTHVMYALYQDAL